MVAKRIVWKHSELGDDGYIEGKRICTIRVNKTSGGQDLQFTGRLAGPADWRETVSEAKRLAQKRLQQKVNEFVQSYGRDSDIIGRL